MRTFYLAIALALVGAFSASAAPVNGNRSDKSFKPPPPPPPPRSLKCPDGHGGNGHDCRVN